MIDTVALYLSEHDFHVTNEDAFEPQQRFRNGGWRRVQNASQRERRRNGTAPALTWTCRPFPGGMRIRLRIDVSLSKLYFGDNVQEFRDADLPDVVDRLCRRLKDMGVETTCEALTRAMVSRADFSRNIVLSDSMTCSSVMGGLKEAPLSGRWDPLWRDYGGGGTRFGIHTSAWDFKVYDKISDLKVAKHSPSRAVDTTSGGVCASVLQSIPRGMQIVRIEMALTNPRVIREKLAKAGHETPDPRLYDVFSEEVAMAVLLDMLQAFPSAQSDVKNSGDAYIRCLKGGDPTTIAAARMWVSAMVREVGFAGLRKWIEEAGRPPHQYRRLVKRCPVIVDQGSPQDPIGMLRKAVERYEPLRLGADGFCPDVTV